MNGVAIAHLLKWNLPGHTSSSVPGVQSSIPSHTKSRLIHSPSEHSNSPGHTGADNSKEK